MLLKAKRTINTKTDVHEAGGIREESVSTLNLSLYFRHRRISAAQNIKAKTEKVFLIAFFFELKLGHLHAISTIFTIRIYYSSGNAMLLPEKNFNIARLLYQKQNPLSSTLNFAPNMGNMCVARVNIIYFKREKVCLIS